MAYKKKLMVLLVLPLFVFGCASAPKVEMASDDKGKKYLEEKYGKVLLTNLYFNPEMDMNATIRLAREDVLGDDKLSDDEREAKMDRLKAFDEYRERGYLTYLIRLSNPEIIKKDDVSITFKDKNGNSIIENTLYNINKRVYYDFGKKYMYNYFWVMKLKKPFTEENFAPGEYEVKVTFPNRESTTYKVFI